MTPEDRAAFERWFTEHRPEAIITSRHDVRDWLAAMGLRAPDDIGLATLWPHEDWAALSLRAPSSCVPPWNSCAPSSGPTPWA